MRLPKTHHDLTRRRLGLQAAGTDLADDLGWQLWLRESQSLFHPDRLDAILAAAEPRPVCDSPDSPERIARHWLGLGGKRLRPFITVAASAATLGVKDPGQLPGDLWPLAVAVEAFHKASLVHDDIEDDDPIRYGEPTLHRTFGLPVAINAGDYLLGLGYRLVASTARADRPQRTVEMLNWMSTAHVRLAQGQGAELTWRTNRRFDPPPAQVLRTYALKTATAFEAALAGGLLVAGHPNLHQQPLGGFASQLGVGFQLLNDLADWDDDCRAGRPTWLTARALRLARGAERAELDRLLHAAVDDETVRPELTRRLKAMHVFADAARLLLRLRERCLHLARTLDPPRLARLCEFLVEYILGRKDPGR